MENWKNWFLVKEKKYLKLYLIEEILDMILIYIIKFMFNYMLNEINKNLKNILLKWNDINNDQNFECKNN